MAFDPGGRFGSFEIVAPLGAGGMGEVYRAHDTTLGRDVALKVLPTRFAADADRVARLRREAELLASLNHPNIAQIYGIETGPDGALGLALELVEGWDLNECIEAGSLAPGRRGRAPGAGVPVPEALGVARQLAEALVSRWNDPVGAESQ
ncbi:MAG: hypothetical protein CL441_05825 [Acidimicrobiaceae bacterium]|nr:hypothetical protein [Acidimicrobiaceae bacterium]